jgi:hypothetical protein
MREELVGITGQFMVNDRGAGGTKILSSEHQAERWWMKQELVMKEFGPACT